MRVGLLKQARAPQQMDVPRKGVSVGYVTMFPVGSVSFSVPTAGRYKFYLWGAGGAGNAVGYAACSGAYSETTRTLQRGQVVTGTVGLKGYTGITGGDSSLLFPDGTSVLTGGGSRTVPGVSTGGDVNLPGSTGGDDTGTSGQSGQGTGGGSGQLGNAVNIGGGAGAPANLPVRGGKGGTVAGVAVGQGCTPGGGAGGSGNSMGGDGLLIVYRVG